MNLLNYEFDPSKDADNQTKHGVSLALVESFDWELARVREDVRVTYAERRFQALGYVEGRLYVVVFCFRGQVVRVISMRKANSREVNAYAKPSKKR